VLFDLGVYNVTSLTGLLGPAKGVTAMSGVAVSERMAEGSLMKVEANDNAHVLIVFGECVFAVVTTGFTIQRYRGPAIELYGTTGTIQMLGDDWAPDGYELWQNDAGAW
jgi:predicted dehydrogenase